MDNRHIAAALRKSSLVSDSLESTRPLDASQFLFNGDRTEQEPESLLMEYYRVLIRRRGPIALFALAGALIGLATTLTVLPVYRARTSLDIQSLNADFMGMRDVAPTGQNETASSGEAYIQTQIKLLQSDTLRVRTVERMKKDGLATPSNRNDTFSGLKRSLHLSEEQPLTSKALLAYAAKHVTIKALGVTRLVEVTCDSWKPKLSAAFCNTLTREFAEQDREVRWNEAQKTSEWLSRQLADLRESLSHSEHKLESATGTDALSLHGTGGSVAEQKLRDLQSELMRAQADRMVKQAQYAIGTSASPDSVPVVLDSGPLKESEAKLEDLRRQVAALVPPLTQANPKVQHLLSQIQELERSVGVSRGNLLSRMRNEYDAARQRESLLAAAYATQEKRVSEQMGREAQISMLRREVESGQQLYQTLLQRVKEAGFASAMQASTIRVVDPAEAPQMAIAPRRGSSSVVGLLIGMLVGIAACFFKERTQTLLRNPGEVPRYLHLRELGVIPTAKGGMRQASPRPAIQNVSSSGVLLEAAQPAVGKRSGERVLDMAVWQDQASLVAEAYRNATYSILLAGKEIEGSKAYVISSPNVADGKTTVVCNLGLALAQANRRVLLIDGDIRKPRLHKAMRVANEVGLRDLLRGDLNGETAPISDFCQSTEAPNLFILTSGSGSEEPSSLLHSPRLKMLLRRLEGEFDVVLLDTPPMLHLADARILAGMAKGVILVFRARTTDRETALTARDLFFHDRVPVIGTILNDFDASKEGKVHHYKDYYAYQTIVNDPAPASKDTWQRS